MTQSDNSSSRPTFIQKRKCIGLTVILVLIAAGVVFVLGLALGVGIRAGIPQASRLEESLNIDELMDMLKKLEDTGSEYPEGRLVNLLCLNLCDIFSMRSRSVLNGYNKSAGTINLL